MLFMMYIYPAYDTLNKTAVVAKLQWKEVVRLCLPPLNEWQLMQPDSLDWG